MASITLEKLDRDLTEIRMQLLKLTHLLEEDFELSDRAKRGLAAARKQPLSAYVDHARVMKEFAP